MLYQPEPNLKENIKEKEQQITNPRIKQIEIAQPPIATLPWIFH